LPPLASVNILLNINHNATLSKVYRRLLIAGGFESVRL
jgi:hypothetical protein